MAAHEFHFFVPERLAAGTTSTLAQSDRDHLQVVRASRGQAITVADPAGRVFEASIDDADIGTFTVVGERTLTRAYAQTIEMCACVIETGNRWNDLLGGVVQAGADRIVPVALHKGDERIAAKRTDRSERIVEAAAKQAKRERRPDITECVNIADLGDGEPGIVLDPDTPEQLLTVAPRWIDAFDGDTIRVLIGPPAGIDRAVVTDLVAAGWTPAGMGTTVLRSELAAAGAVLTLVQALAAATSTADAAR